MKQIGSMEGLARVERADGDVVSVRISERKLRGSGAGIHVWLFFQPADESARPWQNYVKVVDPEKQERPLPGLAQWGLVNEGCSHFPAHVLDLSFECCHVGHGDEHSGGNPFSTAAFALKRGKQCRRFKRNIVKRHSSARTKLRGRGPPGIADAWLKMAQQWRLLADQIERSEHLNQAISGLQHD